MLKKNNTVIVLLLLQCLFLGSCASKAIQKKQETISSDLFRPVLIRQPLTSINIIDRNGLSETITSKDRLKPYQNTDFLTPQSYQKVLRIFAKDKEGIGRSIITSYHTSGGIKQYLEAVNGRAHGFYVEWHPNGKRKLLACVSAGTADIDMKSQLTWSFDGISFAWDEEGHLLTSIPYQKGELNGVSKEFYPDGTLSKMATYKQGLLDGELKRFSKDGAVLEAMTFREGVPEGESLGFWPSGKIAWKEKFQNGLLEEASYFDSNGLVISTISQGNGKQCLFDDTGPKEFHEFKSGKEEGEVTLLENNQFIQSRFFIKNGEKHGEETLYYPIKPFLKEGEKGKQKPKLSIDWYEGKINGSVKTWYDNGVQESQKEMSQNLKQGVLTCWYRNGNLMLIEEYDKDKLVRGEYLKKGESIPISKVEAGKGVASLFDCDGNFFRKIRYQDGKPIDDVTN